MARTDALFDRLRRSRFAVENDPNSVLMNQMMGQDSIHPIGFLEDNSVTSDTIVTDAVIARHVQADAITAGKIAADAISAREIQADAVTASEIAANTITAAEIAANTITANEIAANAITANELAANSVVAGDITANAVTAGNIAADAVTATEIAALTITAAEIAADAITTSKVLAGNITSSRIELSITGKNFGANDGTSGAPGLYFDASSNVGLFRNGGGGLSASVLGFPAFAFGTTNISLYDLTPGNDALTDLGSTTNRWDVVYRVSESSVSDERQKRDIEDAPLGLDFVRSLKPRTFRWRDSVDTQARESAKFDAESMARECRPHESKIRRIRAAQREGKVSDEAGNAAVALIREKLDAIRQSYMTPVVEAREKRRPGRRKHYGLIAQEVKAALDAAGVDSMDAGFWQESPEGDQALSYSELMIPLLRAVQELAQRIESLESA